MARDEAYHLAEKKIEEVRRTGAPKLDLSNKYDALDVVKLTELPESIGELTQLEWLHLSNNQLTALPGSLGQIMQLQELNLFGNQLTSLPESIGRLEQLQSLNLSSNQLTSLPDAVVLLTQLRSLDLSGNQLVTLPEGTGNLSLLQDLNLTGNQLNELPESLGKLTQLKILHLSQNQLSSLPEALGRLRQLEELYLSNNKLKKLPESIGSLTQLQLLYLSENQLTALPNSIEQLKLLHKLSLAGLQLTSLPMWICRLESLEHLILSKNNLKTLPIEIANLEKLDYLCLGFEIGGNPLDELPENLKHLQSIRKLTTRKCNLSYLPEWIGTMPTLTELDFRDNNLTDLPTSLVHLEHLEALNLDNNPLNPELAEADRQGVDAVKLYLRAGAVTPIFEAKLILVGEGEVGKTCLLDALLDKPWQEHPSTHGIEIQQFKVVHDKEKDDDAGENSDVNDEADKIEITLNGWDFGGQRVYRPTHQLFFSAPAVYLVVWKPREGPQQGFVKEWIQLIKRREPAANILVVSTHGGPHQRQPDIDRQELWDLFGKETVVDFFFVDSKPDENGNRKGIEELKLAIAQFAAELPEVGRSVPKSFQEVRETLQKRNVPYLPLDEVLAICRDNKMDDEIADLFIKISHRLGHLTHYENDPALRDIVILRPDWLATAMSYVLDDEETRKAHGLVKFSRLSQLWSDPSRLAETRYPEDLHEIFLRLMERFDLSYRVAGLSLNEETNPISLIAQLVPDNNPEESKLERAWQLEPESGDIQQTQICRIVDVQKGKSANAEGLFYQLIVRLHKYSLGRDHYDNSVHWQRGLILDDDYNGRAMLRHIDNDIHITVRAPYPERFLAMLTEEVRYLVEGFWEGLHCDVMVPCLNSEPCIGLFEVSKLIENAKRGRPEQPCPICNEWQNIDKLLRNAPAATQPISLDVLMKQFAQVKDQLSEVNDNTRRILSQVDKSYTDLLQILTDEAKEGPRLFSLFPLDRSNFNPKNWIRAQFRLVLWCEHSRLPLPALNGIDSEKGIYDLDLDREWFTKSAPYLKFLAGTLGMVLPVASSTVKLALDETAYKLIEEQLDFGKNVIDATIEEMSNIRDFLGPSDATTLEHGVAVRSEGASLRELHALLKAKDPGFGGLVRVMNKRQEFLWVHEKFASGY